jgi:hypothetical protein
MSIQLIVYPQSYDGSFNSIVGSSSEYIVDGINFTTINTSTSSLNLTAPTYTSAISNMSVIPINTWYRFSGDGTAVTESAGSITIGAQRGVIQQLSNLSVNTGYTLSIDVGTYASTLEFQQYTGTILQATFPITSSGTNTISFQAQSTSDTILIYSTATNVINSISVTTNIIQPSGNTTFLGTDGQVICDLYEDEDLPLSLSIDDFKNVAEQVQSYSKAFSLPGTKKNNKIFDNLFDITRSDDGVIFNPYVKTQCKLKQDGFIIFEGYLRMIDVQDKKGEISYNVNLYSEVIALADVLGDRKFRDLGFEELEHDYNKTQIKYSWNDAPNTGITYTNPNTSGFRDANDTLKYPFCDWERQIIIANNPGGSSGPTDNFPQLPNLGAAFRPFIQIKYLINRIFNQSDFPFTYESVFFDTDDFEKLYMDFNWGGTSPESGSGSYAAGDAANTSTGSYQPLFLFNTDFPSDAGYDESTHIFTAQNDNTSYTIDGVFYVGNLNNSADLKFRWLHKDSGGTTIADYYLTPFLGGAGPLIIPWNVTLRILLQQNDTLEFQYYSTASNSYQSTTCILNVTIGLVLSTSNVLMQNLRGETEQWGFLKGIMTMFNLISIPDKSNPNHIIIEPYKDIFMSSDDAANPNFFDSNSNPYNWTDKIDVEEIKLKPLTDLNKKTHFKFVEDEDDYAFNVYKKSVEGHLYGTEEWDASISGSGLQTLLTGEEDIIAEPFAATVVKPLISQFSDFIVPAIYSYDASEGTSEGFDNSPRIMYNNGKKTLTTCTYYIPEQNGLSSENQSDFLQFSHLTSVPTAVGTKDFHFGICQLLAGLGNSVPDNLFNLYWLPYLKELYDADTRIMTIKVNLTPGDINTFKFYDTVIIKNREFRVNKIDYKPNDLATIEFILIP